MTELIIAIATLCGSPSYGSNYYYAHKSEDVLQCQKYYIECTAGASQYSRLPQCILDKKDLGGKK